MKKAASIFFKSRKFITAWFDNECVATPVVLPKNILQWTRSRLTVQCWWKTKKININILIAKGELEPLQPPPPGCAFDHNNLRSGVHCKKERMLLQILSWYCVESAIHPRRVCARRATHKYMWRKRAIIEWPHWVISVVACCHGAKLYVTPRLPNQRPPRLF